MRKHSFSKSLIKIFAALLLMLIVGGVAQLMNETRRSDGAPQKDSNAPWQGQPASTQTLAPSIATKPNPTTRSATTEEILERARSLEKRMADGNRGNRPIKDIVLVTKAEFAQTRAALTSIKQNDALYEEAARLLKQIYARSAEGEKATAAAVAKAIATDVSGRKRFAKDFERNALSKGLSVTVLTGGAQSEILTLEYPALSKAGVYQVMNDPSFQTSLKARGFKKLIVKDGYKWTGNVALQ
jgi:hypothetical protein